MRPWSLGADDETSKGELRRTPDIASLTRAAYDLHTLLAFRWAMGREQRARMTAARYISMLAAIGSPTCA